MKKNLLFTTSLMAFFLLGACSETEIMLEQPQKIGAASIEPNDVEEGVKLKEEDEVKEENNEVKEEEDEIKEENAKKEVVLTKDTTKKEWNELKEEIQNYLKEYYKATTEKRNGLMFNREVAEKWFDVAGYEIITGFEKETWLENEEQYTFQNQEGTLKNEHIWSSEIEVIDLLKEYRDEELDLPAFEVVVKVKDTHQYYDENEVLIENKTYTEEYKATAYLAKVDTPYGYAVIGFDYEKHI